MSDLLDNLRENLVAIMAGVLIVALLGGYGYFAATSIVPQWQQRGLLATQLEQADALLASGDANQSQAVTGLLDRINSAPTRMAAAGALFMPVTAPDQVVDSLYRYAADSNISIAELKVATPTAGAAFYQVTAYQLRANGKTVDLLRFVGRIEEAQHPGYIIDNVSLSQGEGNNTLTLNIAVYSSELAVATGLAVVPGAPAAAEVAAAPTVPAAPPITHVVAAGESLLSIATAYHVPVPALKQLNGLVDNGVTPGQALQVPR